MKKAFLYLVILSMITVFTLAGCKNEIAEDVDEMEEVEETSVEEAAEESEEATDEDKEEEEAEEEVEEQSEVSSIVEGEIVGADSKQSIDAIIMLCRITGEGSCRADPSGGYYSSSTQGTFRITEVTPGDYVVLYSLKSLDKCLIITNKTINYKLGPTRSFDSIFTKEFFETFGGGEGITVSKGTTVNISDGNIVSIDGSFTSEKYGVTMDFHNGKPLTVEVEKGQVTEIKIEAWGL